MDDAPGPVAADASGNGYDVRVSGGLGGTGRVAGRTALLCDGATTEAATDRPVLRTDRSFTVAAWVRLTAKGAYRVAVSQDGTARSAFTLQYDPTVDRWSVSIPDTDSTNPVYRTARSATAPALNTWTHVAGVFDAGRRELSLYVDGVRQATTTGVTAWNGSGPLRVGRSFSGSRFHGSLGDVVVAARALPAWEIARMAGP